MIELEKRDIRLQIFITPAMDDKIIDIAELMGMSKNELVRMAIGQLTLGYQSTIDILKASAEKEMAKDKKLNKK